VRREHGLHAFEGGNFQKDVNEGLRDLLAGADVAGVARERVFGVQVGSDDLPGRVRLILLEQLRRCLPEFSDHRLLRSSHDLHTVSH
jgi:hypothetical protein